MFEGSIPALITPFKDGAVDTQTFARFVEWQIAEGSNGLVPVGTTGESPTLSHEEHKRVVEICIETANKRVPVIAGAGSNSTAEAIDFSRHAKDVGADAVLVVMPYYNKPTQEGLYLHIKAINDAVDIPIILYNVPGRTVSDMQVATMARCAKLKNVVGVKDATANLARASLQRAACGEDFIMLSGEDATALGFNAHGGRGCISVTANVAPALSPQSLPRRTQPANPVTPSSNPFEYNRNLPSIAPTLEPSQDPSLIPATPQAPARIPPTTNTSSTRAFSFFVGLVR